ncbi:hypothetical protein CDL12_29609 [Handroanthus impetiginosus]|uniref:Uncharacterized protein n=1 Tax=Handroanthus impetiginosus TaxID=429701 RepID=A0A2G9FXW8_9LAMI|nr:hypothetical protein CDL12_29609 [Handroanthus impetiginosus]
MLNSCPRKEDPQMERINLGMELTQHYRIDMVHHQQPSIADPTAQNFPYPYGPIAAQFFPSINGLGSVNQVGPLGFDLNIPAEEAFGEEPSQPLDLNMALADQRARCAEARRKRRGILKIKAMRHACGIKLPTSI